MGGGKGKKKFPEGAVRINYLQQCRHDIVTSVGGYHGRVLAAHMGQVMVSIGKKSQIRLGSKIKQSLCKGCGGILVPGLTSNTKLNTKNKKAKSMRWICQTCNTEKTVFLNMKPGSNKERVNRKKTKAK